MALRRDDVCVACAEPLPAGTRAWWDPSARAVTCLPCLEPAAPASAELPPAPPDVAAPELDRGTAGGSAREEGERRAAKREADLRARHPRIGGLLHTVTDDPATTRVWARGAVGEERVGQTLEDARAKGIEVLHDCSIPRSKANIDHLVVAPTGVWVVDAKRYVGGKLERRDVGGWRKVDHRLYVRGRDQSKLIAGVAKQVGLVAESLAPTRWSAVPVRGALCFVDAEVGWFASPFTIESVLVTWRKELVGPLVGRRNDDRPVAPDQIEPLARHLATTFQPR